jgi:hypothetical protein
VQDLRDRLDAWTDAGLLDPAQAAAIERFERVREDAAVVDVGRPGAPDRPAAAHRLRRVSPAEAIGYVGAALAVSALAWMLGEIWVDLRVTAQLTLIGLVTVLLFGGASGLRRLTAAPLQRLTSVLLIGGIAGATWFVGVLGSSVLELPWQRSSLLVTATAAVLAVPLYLVRQRGLPQVVALGSLLAVVVAAMGQFDLEPRPWAYGVVVSTIGLAWLLLSLGRWLRPIVLSGVLGGGLALVGMQVASSDWRLLRSWPWLALGLVIAAGLVALALRCDTFHHLVVGAIGLFVFTPQLVFELFGETIGGPATLLVVGLLLVLLAVGLGRAGREVRGQRRDDARTPTPTPSEPATDRAEPHATEGGGPR